MRDARLRDGAGDVMFTMSSLGSIQKTVDAQPPHEYSPRLPTMQALIGSVITEKPAHTKWKTIRLRVEIHSNAPTQLL